MNPKLLLAGTLTFLALGASASAQSVVLLTQDRYVMGKGEVIGINNTVTDLDEVHAPDFATFEENVLGLRTYDGAQGRGYAHQESYVLPQRIYATGAAHCSAYSGFQSEGIGSGRSHFEVEFRVDQATDFRACGFLMASDNGSASARLTRDTTSIFSVSLGGPFEEEYIEESGTLQPGTYTLKIYASGTVIQSFASGTYDLMLSFEPLVNSYCTSSPHSAGPGAQMGYVGSSILDLDEFSLTVFGAVPQSTGLFYYGSNQQSLPFGDGIRCVGGSIQRLAPQTTDATGYAIREVDLSPFGDFTSGSQWHFQYWFRDSASTGAGFNLSNGLRVVFCP